MRRLVLPEYGKTPGEWHVESQHPVSITAATLRRDEGGANGSKQRNTEPQAQNGPKVESWGAELELLWGSFWGFFLLHVLLRFRFVEWAHVRFSCVCRFREPHRRWCGGAGKLKLK
jgi:hypothetical protein